ncbi:MAG TPA: PEP-CTERM sorting domain-containing protein [Vicinamibacterales bacterium]|nr:PEP-CTERM sorting domain-containing protein [Vicinamibacterales bacterium]
MARPAPGIAPETEKHRKADLGLDRPKLDEPAQTAPSHSSSSGSAQADAPRGWEPWENESSTHAPAQAALGPLWVGMAESRRVPMALFYTEPGGGVATAASRPAAQQPGAPAEHQEAAEPEPEPETHHTPAPGPTPPAQGHSNPPAGPAPPSSTAPANPGIPFAGIPPLDPPGASSVPATPSNTIAAIPPTNPFVEHTTGPADPFVPRPPEGLLDPTGAGGGTGSISPRSPASTPEPASMLLIGTGLVALLSDLRRRRVI